MTRQIDLLRSQEKAASKGKGKAPARKPSSAGKSAKKSTPPEADEFASLYDENQAAEATVTTTVEEFAALPEEDAPIDTKALDTQEIRTESSAATNSFESALEVSEADTFTDTFTATDADRMLGTLNLIVGAFLTAFRKAASDEPFKFANLEQVVSDLTRQLESNPRQLDRFELMLANHEKEIRSMDPELGDLLEKSMIMMLYAVKIGLQLSLSQRALLRLTLAATLHHLGMARIPNAIRNKKGLLTTEELKMVSNVPVLSAEYLQSNGLGDPEILQAIEHVHERHDGSGPKGLEGSDIPPMARMIGLLSMFESLVHLRPYRERLLPRDAIRLLIKEHKKVFDPTILKALIDAISLYPVGCFVQLNTGEVGQVISVNPRLPLRPRVKIRFNRSGEGVPSRKVDLSTQPTLMIRRCMYEESAEESAVDPNE